MLASVRATIIIGNYRFFCRKILLAHYVGDLSPDEEDPGAAEARALNYESRDQYLEALFKGQKSEINKRFKTRIRRMTL
jgi:hypothetical protein